MGQVLPEFPVIVPEFFMINNKNGCTILMGEVLQQFLPGIADMVYPVISTFLFPLLLCIHYDFCHYMIHSLHK